MMAALRTGGRDRARWVSRLASIAVLALAMAIAVPAALLSPARADAANPPELGGLASSQEFEADALGLPFAAITIASSTPTVTATVSWLPTDLTVSNLPSGSQGLFSVTDSPANVQAALRAIDLDAVTDPPATTPTSFSVNLDDGAGGTAAGVTAVSVDEPDIIIGGIVTVVGVGTAVYGGAIVVSPTYPDGNSDQVLTPPTCGPELGVPPQPSVGTYPTVCTGGTYADGWNADLQPGTLTVTAAAATVTASGGSTTYGSPVPITVTPTYGPLQYGQTSIAGVVCQSNVTATTPAGVAASTCSGASDPNYSVSYVPGSIAIAKAPLTITAGNAAGQRGATPAVTPSFSGFLNGDLPASLSTQPTCTSTAVAVTNVGTYPNSTSCSGAAANNYSFTYAKGSTTITPSPLTVTAVSSTRQVGATNAACSVNYSGFVGGETTTVLTGTLACSTSASTSSGPGSYPVTPSGLSSPNYNITFLPGTITVRAAPPPTPTPTPTVTPTRTPTPTPTPTRTTPTPTPTQTGTPDGPTDLGWVPIVLAVGGGLLLVALVVTFIAWSRRRGM